MNISNGAGIGSPEHRYDNQANVKMTTINSIDCLVYQDCTLILILPSRLIRIMVSFIRAKPPVSTSDSRPTNYPINNNEKDGRQHTKQQSVDMRHAPKR